MKLAREPIQGLHTRLEPLEDALRSPLAAALSGCPQDWALMAGTAAGEAFAPWWARVTADMEAGTRIAYAVRRLEDDAIVGTTSFIDIAPAHGRVEIGMTFLAPGARGGPVNPDIKLAMLAHALAAGAVRVEIVTDARNARSQAAIEKLGAVREGVLRRHKITWTGYVRDSVVYSITDLDWPTVRDRLTARLDRFARPGAP